MYLKTQDKETKLLHFTEAKPRSGNARPDCHHGRRDLLHFCCWKVWPIIVWCVTLILIPNSAWSLIFLKVIRISLSESFLRINISTPYRSTIAMFHEGGLHWGRHFGRDVMGKNCVWCRQGWGQVEADSRKSGFFWKRRHSLLLLGPLIYNHRNLNTFGATNRDG